MLTTPRAIVFAAALVTLATIAHALLPRYDIRIIDNGAGYARVDHWTGRMALAGRLTAERGPAPWLIIEQTLRRTPAPSATVDGPGIYTRALRFSGVAGTVLGLTAVTVGLFSSVLWLRRRSTAKA